MKPSLYVTNRLYLLFLHMNHMESVDIEYYNSMVQTVNMDESELAALNQIEDENFGAIVFRELKPVEPRKPLVTGTT